MKNRRIDILDAAGNLFSSQGIKATGMDEIAQKCGISKKTLYRYFASKDALVQTIVQQLILKMEQHIRIWRGISPNAVLEIKNCFRYLQDHLYIITPLFMKDLVTYYGTVYNLLIQAGRKRFVPFVRHNIAKGMAEQLYRFDIDSDLVSMAYFWQLKNITTDPLITGIERQQLLSYINDFFLWGILSENGKTIVKI